MDRKQPVLYRCFNGSPVCQNTVLHIGESCPYHATTVPPWQPGSIGPDREGFRRHLYERLRDYSRSLVRNPALEQEVRAIIHREHVLAGGALHDMRCPNCIDMVSPSQE